MYIEINTGRREAVRGCKNGNQLPNNLEDFSTYNLGRIFFNLKKYRLKILQFFKQGVMNGI